MFDYRCVQVVESEDGCGPLSCLLHGVIDNQNDAVTVKNRDLQYVIVNRAACEYYGRTAKELIGRTAKEIFGSEVALPQDVLDRQAFEGTGAEDHEEARQRADGVFDYYSVSRTLIHGCNGAVHLLQTRRNISEQRRVTERLTNLYSIINLGPVIAFRIKANREMTVEFMSENIRQLGYRLQDVYCGHVRLVELVYSEDRERVADEIRQSREQMKDRFALELRVVNADGRALWYAGRVSAIRDSSGAVTHYQGVAFDVSERRSMEADLKKRQRQLIQADKMVSIGTLVSGVAHEINNPAGFIMLNAPMLEEMWKPILELLVDYSEDRNIDQVGKFKMSLLRRSIPQMLRGITEGAERIKNIVKSLKDFSRQASNDMDACVSLNDVVAASIGLVANSVKRETDRFSVEYCTNLPDVRGNFQRLQQVVVNLLVNACESLENEQQAICVETGVAQDLSSVFVRVVDEGVGITDNNISKVVDPFFTTKRDSGGTGLGLSISNSIVAEHGGKLVFESKEGQGTAVSMQLPVGNSV